MGTEGEPPLPRAAVKIRLIGGDQFDQSLIAVGGSITHIHLATRASEGK